MLRQIREEIREKMMERRRKKWDEQKSWRLTHLEKAQQIIGYETHRRRG